MASTVTRRAIFALLAIFVIMPSASAFALWKAQDAAESTSLQVKVPTMLPFDAKISVHLPKRLQDSKHIIEAFEALPSCPKIATAALMHSCTSPHESAQGNANHAFHTNDALKAYGARLAICELMEAHGARTLIPKDCSAFVPTSQSIKKQTMAGHVSDEGISEPTVLFPGYDEVTEDNLHRCITGLAQEPQSWSSYSNSKQNAVLICQSVQGELQLETAVKTYEKIIDNFGGITELHEQMAAQAYNAQLAQLSEVRAAARELVLSLNDQWSQIFGNINADVSSITKELQEQLHDASETTRSSLQNIQQATTNVNQDITAMSQQAGQAATQVEFVADYIEHNVMRYLGMVLHDLGLQQDFVKYNNDVLRVAEVGLVEMVSQVNQTNNELATTQVYAHHLRNQLQQANSDVEKFNDNVGYLANIVSYGWSGVIGKLMLFCASVAVITPFTFGFWERIVGFSFLGNCGTALSTGLVFGFAFAYLIDPTTLFQEYHISVLEDEFTAYKPVLTGLLIGILGTLSITMIHRAIKLRFASKPYDPASPPIGTYEEKEKQWLF